MRTVRRLRLRYLLFTSTPDVLPLSLSHHVETGRTHLMNLQLTRTKDLRLPRCPKNKSHVQTYKFLRWIRGESNSRPQCLHYEGITTILLIN